MVSLRATSAAGGLRIVFVIFGGMAVLQSSQSLDAAKLGYLFGASVAFVVACWTLWVRRHRHLVRLARPWLLASVATVVLVGISYFVARAEGTAQVDWFRDAATYLLFASVPVFALDSERSIPRRWLVGMLLIAGVLGGFSWALEWLARRDILELPLRRLLFPSPHLPVALYVFAMASAVVGGRRWWLWASLAGLIFGLFLVTGTRSSLVLLAGPLAIAVFAGRQRLGASIRSFGANAAVAVAVVLAFQLTFSAGLSAVPAETNAPSEPSSSEEASTSRPDLIAERFGEIGSVVTDPGSDQSIRERVAQYVAAWQLFASSPLVGVGLGHAIEWIDTSGFERSAFTADSPLVYLVKFGLLGMLTLVLLAGAYVATVRGLFRQQSRSVVGLTMLGYAVWALVTLPLGFPLEDKGASLALILVLALAFGDLVPSQAGPHAAGDTSGAVPLGRP